MVDAATATASAAAPSAAPSAAATGASAALPALKLAGPVPMLNNPGYAALDNLAIAGAVLVFILLLVKFGRALCPTFRCCWAVWRAVWWPARWAR